MKPDTIHEPVMLKEAIEGLQIKKGKWYVDATLGTGGHAQAILDKGGYIIGIDRDKQALKIAQKRLPSENVHLVHENFNKLRQIVTDLGMEKVQGVLFDFGASSLQFDSLERGFSFMHDAELDMRMSKELAVKAKDLVNALSEKEMYVLFKKYGGEQRARAIAQAIGDARQVKPFETTQELVDTIMQVKQRTGKLHPATKVFQALRIAVNDELNAIKETLPQLRDILVSGGRVVTISFHQGEDGIVKHFFKDHPQYEVTTPKPLTPNQEEIALNPRARSAKLRITEKRA